MKKNILSACLFAVTSLNAGLTPDYDERCNAMFCKNAKIDPTQIQQQVGYFDKPVPKIVHQIWFGDPARLETNKVGLWEEYSQEFDYQYYLWSEKDDSLLKNIMNPLNFELMIYAREIKNYPMASDILRYELIKCFGGIYVDCDFMPPCNTSGLIDLADITSFKGLTLMTEHQARNLHDAALFVASSLIISCPEHPVIVSMVNQIYPNTLHWYSIKEDYNPSFVAGPFLLNKVLTGCFAILPSKYLYQFEMYVPDSGRRPTGKTSHASTPPFIRFFQYR